MLKNIIPKQTTGAKTGAIAHKKCDTLSRAKALFKNASQKLLDINNWGNYAGENESKFTLTDSRGDKIISTASKGNFIKIKITAPHNKEGDGYDWVKIEHIYTETDDTNNYEYIVLQVRPHKNPKGSSNTAHFYTDSATSTFCIIRKYKTVFALELGRNEKPNTNVTLLNSVRNYIIAMAARLGLAKLQWKKLMKGFLHENF